MNIIYTVSRNQPYGLCIADTTHSFTLSIYYFDVRRHHIKVAREKYTNSDQY
jgi:hypothetical protein